MENHNNGNRNNNQRGNSNNKRRFFNDDKQLLPYETLTSDNYVALAENVINYLKNNQKLLSTSQIRNLLSLNTEIYNTVLSERSTKLSDDVKSRLQYLKVRMVYDSGREEAVKLFVQNSHLIDHLDEIGESKEKYMLFARYLEALVAYRKFAGRDS